MEKQEKSINVPAELSIILGEGSTKKEDLSFKTLLERFYNMNNCITEKDPSQDAGHSFLKGTAEG
jgi:hypothetical protein